MIRLKKNHHELVWGTEDWIISGHLNGDNEVIGEGVTLSNFYKNNKEYFGNCPSEVFPLLVKIIDAKKDLSVQVHPDDKYANEHENSLGKTECWYVLDAADDADIIVGQTAKTRDELKKAIDEGKILDYLDVKPVKKGDFFYIPSGAVHAIRSNTKILEIQQSSDITYRLYDYNRPGTDGKLRELHVDKSLDVINYDFKVEENNNSVSNINGNEVTTFVDNDFFKVVKVDVNNDFSYQSNKYFTMGITLGELTVNNQKLSKNETFILKANEELKVSGNATLFISTYGG